jgi:hypothetical protein
MDWAADTHFNTEAGRRAEFHRERYENGELLDDFMHFKEEPCYLELPECLRYWFLPSSC